MDVLFGSESKALHLTDFQVPTVIDDDSSVLIANTNKLLSAVGISAKKISTTDELSRVASSLIVAVFESLFHQRVDGIIRNPRSKDDYERNAQLIIDSLSDQIQVDLKHITGRSIVSGDLRVLSNLIHILVRIVSLTSQESLTSYDSSDHVRGLNFLDGGRNRFYRAGRNGDDSISTRHSEQDREHASLGISRNRDPYYVTSSGISAGQGQSSRFLHGAGALFEQNVLFRGDGSNSFGALDGDGGGGILFNADLRRSLQKADRLLHLEGKIEAARRRRENALFLKESASRAANLRHAEVSREALQQKWLDDADRARQAFELRRTSDDQVALRKIYKGLLQKVVRWKVEEAQEVKAKNNQLKEQTSWHIESLQQLFEERMRVLSQEGGGALRSRKYCCERDELAMASDLVRSVESRNRALLGKEKARLQERRERELLRRKEAHGHLLALLSASSDRNSWQDALRDTR